MENVTEAPASLSPPLIASLFGATLVEGGIDIAGIHLIGESLELPLTPEDMARKAADKMRINALYSDLSDPYSNTFWTGKGHEAKIIAKDWALHFEFSGRHRFDRVTDACGWNGKRWMLISKPEIHGDYDKFQHDAAMLMLFSSEWMLDAPKDDLFGGLFVAGIGMGKSSMFAQIVGREARSQPNPNPVVYYDYESLFRTSKKVTSVSRDYLGAMVLAMGIKEEKTVTLKIIKNR